MSFSILNPNGAPKFVPINIKEEFDRLGVSTLLGSNAHTFFTNDPETLQYRLDIFDDMVNIAPLQKVFAELNEKLKEYSYFRNMRASNDTTGLFRQLSDIRFFTDFIDVMYANTKEIFKAVKSDGLIKLFTMIKDEAESPEFNQLKESFKQVDQDLMSIKSVTIGVNLDSNLNPKEAGLLKINSEVFKSGSLIDKFLRMDFRDSEFNCLAPITQFSMNTAQMETVNLNTAVNNSMALVMSESLKKCGNLIKAFLSEKMYAFLDLIDEFYFISKATDLLMRIKNKGIPLCKPFITKADTFFITNLYSTALMEVKSVNEIIANDAVFDNDGQIYILTGPNSGGKTVFIRALGVAQMLYQCGLLIPAETASLPLMSTICTHFTTNASNTSAAHSIGRLEEECEHIAAMMEYISADTLVLMDEAFSSTSAKDGLELAESCINKLQIKGCKCIFSTHIHELSERVDAINAAKPNLPKLDKLAAETVKGTRTYKIRRGYSDGTSDAKTIAQKYGLI